ncbi:RimJ/RimL family protein N-acetyltransferase, partial [Streptomyces anulatus]
MTDLWTGERVRLRGIEPQDWEGFRALALHTVDARN